MEELVAETTNLGKRFGKYRTVQFLDVKVEKGSVYGLVGPNGAGNYRAGFILAKRDTLTREDAGGRRALCPETGFLTRTPDAYVLGGDVRADDQGSRDSLGRKAFEGGEYGEPHSRLPRYGQV